MPEKQQERKKDWGAPKFYLNDEPVDQIPQYALDSMAKRLSETVSQYFRQHPDEYVAFLEWKNKNKAEKSI